MVDLSKFISYCEFCNKRLIRKSYEKPNRFKRRRFCNHKCASQNRPPFTQERKTKIRLKLLGNHNGRGTKGFKSSYNGEKHWNWKGGVTPISRTIRNSPQAKEWRKAIFERDDYTCQVCGIRGNQTNGYLEADHIKPFAYYPELRFELSNGRTLCRNCHRATPTWGFKNISIKDRRNFI